MAKNTINYTNKIQFNSISNNQLITSLGKIVVTQKRNNCVISITTLDGKVLLTETPGTIGYKKSARKNPIFLKEVIKILSTKILKKTNFKYFQLIFKGISRNKKIIINSLLLSKIKLFSITSEIFIPKNGCKLKKQRRL